MNRNPNRNLPNLFLIAVALACSAASLAGALAPFAIHQPPPAAAIA